MLAQAGPLMLDQSHEGVALRSRATGRSCKVLGGRVSARTASVMPMDFAGRTACTGITIGGQIQDALSVSWLLGCGQGALVQTSARTSTSPAQPASTILGSLSKKGSVRGNGFVLCLVVNGSSSLRPHGKGRLMSP